MRTDNPAYLSHSVFAALERYAGFYEQLSTSIMGFLTPGTGHFININTYLYQSIGGTLNSVAMILGDGRINDAYALVRKYFDSVTLSLYVDVYLNDHRDEKAIAVAQINDWLRRTKALPKYDVMKDYVAAAKRLKPVIGMLLRPDTRYKGIRDRSNGHMHYNDFQSMLLNDRDVHVDRLPVLWPCVSFKAVTAQTNEYRCRRPFGVMAGLRSVLGVVYVLIVPGMNHRFFE